MLAIWLLNKVFDQSAPRSPTSNAKRAEEWGKQPDPRANAAPPSLHGTSSAAPTVLADRPQNSTGETNIAV